MLLLTEGFDHYSDTTHMYQKWSAIDTLDPGSPGQTGRFPAQGSAISRAFQIANTTGSTTKLAGFRTLGSSPGTVIIGWAFRVGSLSAESNLGVSAYDSSAATEQIGLAVETSGAVRVYRGGSNHTATIGTSAAGLIATGTWYYIEMKIVFSTTATGSVVVNLNGPTQILNLTSVQTAQSSNASCDSVAIEAVGNSSSTTVIIDDLYVCDTTGSQNNAFLGDVKYVTVLPASPAGRLDQWAQTGGTGGQPWTAVNETNPDDDTSYVSDATVGDIEDFNLGSHGTIATLYGVGVNAYARKDDAGVRTLGLGVGDGTTENFDAGHALGATYHCYVRTLDSNPLTSAAWATSDLATLQAALKVIA
jgi:hypothetical protein